MATLIGCKPEIISEEGDKITLRIPGGEEGMALFREAIRTANLSDVEFQAEYSEKRGLDSHRQMLDD